MVSFDTTNLSELNMNITMEDNQSVLDNNGPVFEVMDYYNMDIRAELMFKKPHKVIALIFSFITIMVNVIGLIGIGHIRTETGFATRLRLVLSLGCADMLVSLSIFLHIISRIINPIYIDYSFEYSLRLQSICINSFIKGIMIMANIISLFNLLGMALDHFLAIMHPLRYQVLMSRQRITMMLLFFWIVSAIFGFSDFLSGFGDFEEAAGNNTKYNYCEHVDKNNYYTEYIMFATAFICFIIMLYIYGRIYCEVRKIHQRAPPLQQEYKKNRKALLTTLLILGTFVVCWIPYCLFEVALVIMVDTNINALKTSWETYLIANEYLHDLLLLNSLCDPIIYIIRMREVRHGLKRFFKKLPWCHQDGCKKCVRKHSKMRSLNQSSMKRNGKSSPPMSFSMATYVPSLDTMTHV